jgi:hypothetical protein
MVDSRNHKVMNRERKRNYIHCKLSPSSLDLIIPDAHARRPIVVKHIPSDCVANSGCRQRLGKSEFPALKSYQQKQSQAKLPPRVVFGYQRLSHSSRCRQCLGGRSSNVRDGARFPDEDVVDGGFGRALFDESSELGDFSSDERIVSHSERRHTDGAEGLARAEADGGGCELGAGLLSWIAQVGTLLLLDECEVLAGAKADHPASLLGGVALLVVGTLLLDELEVLARAEADHLTGFLGGVAFLVVGTLLLG